MYIPVSLRFNLNYLSRPDLNANSHTARGSADLILVPLCAIVLTRESAEIMEMLTPLYF